MDQGSSKNFPYSSSTPSTGNPLNILGFRDAILSRKNLKVLMQSVHFLRATSANHSRDARWRLIFKSNDKANAKKV